MLVFAGAVPVLQVGPLAGGPALQDTAHHLPLRTGTAAAAAAAGGA